MTAMLAGVPALVALGVAVSGSARETPAPAAVAKPVAAPSPVAPQRPAAQTAPEPLPEDAMVVRRVLDIEKPFRHGDWKWDDAGIPEGPLVITVDLEAQTLSVFRDGYEIGAAVILYGADWKPTPLGVYPITQKSRDHVSNLYGAPMPFMLRLTNDGISIHGSDVEDGAATHGCIGVPTPFAKKLFAVAKLGDRVIVTNGKRLSMGGQIAAL